MNIPSERTISFAGQILPFYYVKYAVEVNQTDLTSIVAGSRLDSQQAISEKFKLLSLENSNEQGLFRRINGFLIGGITVTAATLSVVFYVDQAF